ncbi:hypothetical protein H4R35_002301, partial [Dimargaris xerosporica]
MSATDQRFYVDPTAGSDEQGTGTQDKPFQTAARAFEVCSDLVTNQLLMLTLADPADQASAQYAPISGAAFKKAKKRHDEALRKRK